MTSRYKWVISAVAACIVAAAAATAVTLYRDHTSAARPAAAGNVVQGPPLRAAHVTTASGRRITCPRGSVPYVFIQDAWFSPTLHRGTQFLRGTYRIRMRGTIANETTAPIRISGIHPWVQHRKWPHARVVGPTRLAANSSGHLVIVGRFHNRRTAAAAVGARLSWHWSQPSLRACGKRGLIDDD